MTPTAVAEGIDPRIAARRDAVRRSRRRRWLRGATVLGVVVALGAGAWGLSRTGLADVDGVDVSGTVRHSAEEVATASGIVSGQPLLDVDEAAAAASVESLSWVERATVERDLREGRVAVSVVERRPVAVVAGSPQGPFVVVDAGGLAVADQTPGEAGLPLVEGVPAPAHGELLAEGAPRDAVTVADALTPGLASRVEAVVVIDDQVQLRLRPGAFAMVGDAERLDEKLAALQTIVAEVDLACVPTIDVTAGRTARVTRQGCA